MKSVFKIIRSIWRGNNGWDRLGYLFGGLIWQIRKRTGSSFITTLPSGAKAKIYPSSVFSGIFYYKWLEPKDVLFIRANTHLARTFLDVGANVGLFSALLFDIFSRFYLFEPSASSFAALRETCGLNPSVDCIALNIAVSDRSGELNFLDQGNYSSTSRVVDALSAHGAVTRPVVADTLDNILGVTTDDFILKVDVEGLEERVFLGARELFGAARIKLVLFERLGRSNIDNILKFFADVDYVVFFVDEDGSIKRGDDDVRRPLVNLFACPRACFPLLRFSRQEAACPPGPR